MSRSNRTRATRRIVVAGAGAIALAAAAPALGAPAISGSDVDAWNAANPEPDYTITGVSRRSRIFWAVPGVDSGDGRSPVRVRLRGIPDGAYRLIAVEGSEVDEDLVAVRNFRVDTTPPVVTIRRPVAGDLLDRGSAVTADYSCEGAVTCAGPVPSGAPLGLSVVGPAEFRVSARDDAGNEAVAAVSYAVRPPVVVAAARPTTVRARTLRPRAGVRVTSRRPTLRWRGHPAARLYNVQVFRVRPDRTTKVLSAFPRRSRLRVPAGKLAFGERYVWRIWPYLSGGYPSRPLGLSYFDVRRPRGG